MMARPSTSLAEDNCATAGSRHGQTGIPDQIASLASPHASATAPTGVDILCVGRPTRAPMYRFWLFSGLLVGGRADDRAARVDFVGVVCSTPAAPREAGFPGLSLEDFRRLRSPPVRQGGAPGRVRPGQDADERVHDEHDAGGPHDDGPRRAGPGPGHAGALVVGLR